MRNQRGDIEFPRTLHEKERLENVAGERSRRRLRLNCVERNKQLMDVSEIVIIKSTRVRRDWKRKTAIVQSGYSIQRRKFTIACVYRRNKWYSIERSFATILTISKC